MRHTRLKPEKPPEKSPRFCQDERRFKGASLRQHNSDALFEENSEHGFQNPVQYKYKNEEKRVNMHTLLYDHEHA